MSNEKTAEQAEPRTLKEPAAARYIGMSESFLRKGRMEGTRKGKTPLKVKPRRRLISGLSVPSATALKTWTHG